MNIQQEVQRLEKLFKDPNGNLNEIIRVYYNISKDNSPEASNAVPFLNQSAVDLMSPELTNILKNHRLNSFSYILVANNLMNLEDVKDDLLNGDVLMDNIPPNTIRRLRADLGLGTVANIVDPASIVAVAPGNALPYKIATTDEISLPIEIAKQCRDMKKENGMLLYKLPLKPISTFSGASSITKRFSFGEPSPIGGRASKTILLMGATGSGKTTMINAMINYVLGVKWEDMFRFILIDEDAQGANQAFSQTREVTAYDIHYREGFRIPYSLTIVDTPGFGDTEGIERDMEITSAVKQFFEHEHGIQVIHLTFNFEI